MRPSALGHWTQNAVEMQREVVMFGSIAQNTNADLLTNAACLACWAVDRFSLKEYNKTGGKNTFTCVACHPKEDCIATGHEDGKIRLW